MKRDAIALAAFGVVALFVANAMLSMDVNPGISDFYNKYGHRIAPNMVTLIVFDFRGYDTLGECVILVTGVLAVSMLFGRGLLKGDVQEEPQYMPQSTLVLRLFTPLILSITTALGVYVALGGHITPGGGFQGGSIVAAGMLLALMVLGRKHLSLSEGTLVKMEAFGVFLYIFLGLAGLLFGGYFLYNTGADFYGLVSPGIKGVFNYPDAVNAGILPYLNIAVLIKVSAGISTIALIFLGVKR